MANEMTEQDEKRLKDLTAFMQTTDAGLLHSLDWAETVELVRLHEQVAFGDFTGEARRLELAEKYAGSKHRRHLMDEERVVVTEKIDQAYESRKRTAEWADELIENDRVSGYLANETRRRLGVLAVVRR